MVTLTAGVGALRLDRGIRERKDSSEMKLRAQERALSWNPAIVKGKRGEESWSKVEKLWEQSEKIRTWMKEGKVKQRENDMELTKSRQCWQNPNSVKWLSQHELSIPLYTISYCPCFSISLFQWFSKCGLWISSSITWEVIRNTSSQAPLQTYFIRTSRTGTQQSVLEQVLRGILIYVTVWERLVYVKSSWGGMGYRTGKIWQDIEGKVESLSCSNNGRSWWISTGSSMRVRSAYGCGRSATKGGKGTPVGSYEVLKINIASFAILLIHSTNMHWTPIAHQPLC